ncbi:hypothetical protein [Lysinibacter cavernae]|uniref:Uncharacterized protein n=1 Tax=Lysinibacter cavernae TaxID=1640652 RepID=A0A7X5TS62_9MICO|nr:hypothetical protein [Lysinibacter cavernae]NIH52570.1 hypothetical protein [Lysinibacter cavernae]
MNRVIRFFPDDGNPWPLWETGTEAYMQTPEALGLSLSLTNELRVWTDFWLEHFSFGWDSPANHQAHLDQAEILSSRLEIELSGIAVVAFEVF